MSHLRQVNLKFVSPASLVLVFCASVLGCRNSMTIWSSESMSPDSKWIATAKSVEHRGPGNNDLETMVALKRADNTGESTEVLGFFHDPNLVTNSIDLRMKWLDPSHLEVSYSNHPRVYYRLPRVVDVEITTQDLSGATK